MKTEDRISNLERALLSYVEKYGFTEEARDYFLKHYADHVTNSTSPSLPRA